MRNLYDFYEQTCQKFEKSMLFDDVITYGDAFLIAQSRAAFLQKEGFKKGTSVAILANTSREWCLSYMAITMAGYIAVPLDTNLPASAYPALLSQSKTRAVFGDKDLLKKINSASVRKYDIMFPAKPVNAVFTHQKMDESTPASYVFTSGTTGTPKIVVLTHANVFNTSINTATFLNLNETDVFLSLLPLFHVYAFVANFSGPYATGSSFHFLQSLKGPDIIAKLAEQEFTVFPAAPQLWELFMDSILAKAKSASALKYNILLFFLKTAPFFKAVGLSFIPKAIFKPIHKIFGRKMKYFVSGGAPLKKQYFDWYKNLGLQILEGYGLTETTGPICVSHPKKNKKGSVGPAMNGNEISIRNINKDGIGEIWLRGAAVSPGYLNNPKANREAYDSDGFFNSGDLGRLDRDGYLFVTGRLKNVIVLDSGKNVYPEELESWYKQSGEIEQISVFGKKIHDRETVFAVIVPKEKNETSYDRIASEIARLNKGLPFYKTIAAFAISLEALPANSSRKILVSQVKKNLEDGRYISSAAKGRNESVLQASGDREKAVLKALKTNLKLTELFPSQNFYDLGLGSLDTINLIGALEEDLSVSIDINTFKELANLEAVLAYLSALKNERGISLERQILDTQNVSLPLSFYNPLVECIAFFLSLILRKFYKFSISGMDNYPDESSILVANHESNLDIILMYCAMPWKKRKNLYVIGKKEVSFLSFLLPGINVIFVDRSGDVVPSLKASVALLKKGKSIFIFPEGTRNERIGNFKSGAAWLAYHMKRSIVPIAIRGTAAVLPKGKFFFRTGKDLSLSMQIGRAISVRAGQSLEALNTEIRQSVLKMLGLKGMQNAAASTKPSQSAVKATGRAPAKKAAKMKKTVKTVTAAKPATAAKKAAVKKKGAARTAAKKTVKKSASKKR